MVSVLLRHLLLIMLLILRYGLPITDRFTQLDFPEQPRSYKTNPSYLDTILWTQSAAKQQRPPGHSKSWTFPAPFGPNDRLTDDAEWFQRVRDRMPTGKSCFGGPERRALRDDDGDVTEEGARVDRERVRQVCVMGMKPTTTV
ncbi:hypothetical protein GWI33_021151 [Rhynchophorus ferrugineus]|uniref:Uncharacterized protein n=1 Tax=Rhynchophorus ferrugineus TaxID=354439 RepID=A0A834I204_RHYFE|nr:hypothetical protein GWI33_021151 [Rhynchophorus ferrugineus]